MATYVWRKELGLVEVARVAPEAKLHIQTDAGFDNLRASDGTDLTSRSRWKQYMHDNNLTIANDWKETWAKAAKRREAVVTGKYRDPKRTEAVRRIVNEMSPRDIRAIGERARERARQMKED